MLATNKAQIDLFSLEGMSALIRSLQLIGFAAAKQHLLPVRRVFQELFACSTQERDKKQWVEIPLYGFVSRNYIEFSSGKMRSVRRAALPDGSKLTEFKDGSLIIEATTGHLVEFDKRARVTLVKVTKEEAEGAMKFLHKNDLAEAFRVKNIGKNAHLICLPGNIQVTESASEISVRMPNGVDITRKR